MGLENLSERTKVPHRVCRGRVGMGSASVGSAEACGARSVSHELPSLLGACTQAWAGSMAQVAPRVL